MAVVPLPGAKYDETLEKVFIDETMIDAEENEDERTARILIKVANSIIPGIEMEYDIPSKNSDSKMAILDMKVWIDEEGNIVFQHYEKPTASHNVMNASSAQSISCRNSVHTQEILRRLFNSSPLLDWRTCVAPVISTYMLRMMKNGYPEKYRVDTLNRALNIFDKMVKDDEDGVRPLYKAKRLECGG